MVRVPVTAKLLSPVLVISELVKLIVGYFSIEEVRGAQVVVAITVAGSMLVA
jgi:hypothetical protein